MKYLLIIVLSISLHASLLDELENLSFSQREVLLKTYIKAKPFDYHLTMMAIAWKESKFGKYPINLEDPSCGVFHNLIDTVAKGADRYTKNRICSSLIQDFDYSFSESLKVLKYFENYWRNKRGDQYLWSKTVASYNAGFKWGNGKDYLEDIKARVKALKVYIVRHENVFKQININYVKE